MPQLRSLKVTLIRHGESQDNSDGIWAGFKDSPLTPLGLAQAKALGKSFSNVPLVGIYCSDLKRAAVTANEILVANTTQPPPLLVQSQSLREQNFGVAEGKSWADKDALQLAQASTGEDAREFRFQGGETLEEVNRRMATSVRRFVLPRVEALRQEASKSSSNGGTELSVQPHICIVAHGIAIAELLRVFMSLHDSNYSNPDTTTSSSASNSQPWPWENPTLTYNRVRLENTGYTDIEISIPIGDPTSGLAPISNPISRSNSPIPSTSPLPSSSFRNPDESSQADISTASLNQDASSTSQARAAPPLSLQPSTSFSPIPSKSLFVRILSQNNIEHLRGVSAPATIGKVKGKASSVAASILGGGSSSSGLTSSTTSSSLSSNANLPLPQTPSTGNSGGFPSRSPGAQSSFATSPAASTTPSAATARSLGAYDAKVMAREMEKGQGGMLAGGIPLSAGIGSPSSGTNNHGGDLSATSASGLGLGLGIASSNGSNSYNSNENRSLNSYQMPSSASALYNVFPAGNPNISSTGSGSGSASGAGGVGKISFSTEEREVWNSVSIRVLPLFNGEGLRSHLEDINESVSQHVQATVKRTPGRALDALSADLSNLVNSGMLTLTTKLADSVSAVQSQASRSSGELEAKADERLLTRLVELWTMFWSSVLPYLEGCFLPFHTNQDLVSLTSSAKAANAARSTVSTAGLRTEKIDTRKVILTVFRDAMILPIVDRLFYLFANIRQFQPGIANDYGLTSSKSHKNGSSSSIGINSSSNTVADESAQLCPRLLQMTSVLSSILSNDPAQHAIDALLRALRVGNAAGPESMGDGDRSKASGVGNQQANKNRHGWLPKSAIKHGKGASSLSNPLTSSPRMNINNLNLSQSQSTLVNNLGDERPQYASYYDDMTSSLGSGTIGRGETPSNLRGFSIDSSRDPSSYSNSNAYGISRVPLMTEDDYLSSLKSPVHSPGQSVTSGNSPSPGANNQQPLDQADAKTSSLRAPSVDSGRGSSRPTSSQAGDEFHDASAGSPAIPLEALKTTGIGGNEDEEGDFEPFPTPTTSSVSAFSPYPQAMNSPAAGTSTLTPSRPPRRQSSAASSPTATSQKSPVPPLPRSPNRYSPGNRNANPNQGSPFFNSGVNLSPVSHSHSQSSPSPINPSSSNAQQPHPLSLTRRASDFTTTSPSSEPSLSQDLDSKLFDSTREEIDTSDISTEQDKERARALLSSFEGTWEDVQNALDS